MSLHAPLPPAPRGMPPKQRTGLFANGAPRRGEIQFANFAASCNGPFPTYWTTPNGLGAQLFRVGKKTQRIMKNEIVDTWDPDLVGKGSDAKGLKKCGIDILDIYRLEDPTLFGEYFQERKKLFAQCSSRGELCPDISTLPDSSGKIKSTVVARYDRKNNLYTEVNEEFLFHGTKPENVQSILSNGLDPNKSDPNGMLGQAVYTTECFTKADQYTDSPDARTKLGTELYMILARVLLGRVYVCNNRSELRRLDGPPCTNGHTYDCACPPSQRYDSIMTERAWRFREFAVQQKHRCYPEYVIKYKRTRLFSREGLNSE